MILYSCIMCHMFFIILKFIAVCKEKLEIYGSKVQEGWR